MEVQGHSYDRKTRKKWLNRLETELVKNGYKIVGNSNAAITLSGRFHMGLGFREDRLQITLTHKSTGFVLKREGVNTRAQVDPRRSDESSRAQTVAEHVESNARTKFNDIPARDAFENSKIPTCGEFYGNGR